MRDVLILALLGCLAVDAFAGDDAALPASGATNILVILTDNQSPSLLGAYGNAAIETPNIDRLAAEGTVFENAYATSGVCSPTRASILSGLMPSQHGIHNALPTNPDRIGIEEWAPLAEFETLPARLADAGYQTALIGKYHLGTHTKPQLGFHHWVTMETGHTKSFVDTRVIANGAREHIRTHITDYWTDQAIRYLKERETDRPFFLLLAYNGPYMLPPVVTGPSDSRFAKQYQDKLPSFPQQPVHSFLRNWAISSKPNDHMQKESTHAWAAINALNNPQAMINTAAETTHVDAEIGRLLRVINELGIDENTLIIYTSDQGSSYGHHGLWGNTSWAFPFPAFDAHLKVPMIFNQPGTVAAGRRVTTPVSQIDLYPTIVDAADLDEESQGKRTGRNLRQVLAGESALDERPIYFEFITVRGVRSNDWKLIRRFPDGPDELFNLASDPGETQDLAGLPETADTQATLSNLLDKHFGKIADPRFDLWSGGTGKGRLLGDYQKNDIFSSRFPDWRPPFIENPPMNEQ